MGRSSRWSPPRQALAGTRFASLAFTGIVDGVNDLQNIAAMQHLEEKIAYLTRTVEDLSDVVARQEAVLTMLNRRVQLLMEREAERESRDGHIAIGDRPPHY